MCVCVCVCVCARACARALVPETRGRKVVSPKLVSVCWSHHTLPFPGPSLVVRAEAVGFIH